MKKTELHHGMLLKTPVILSVVEVYKGDAKGEFTFYRDGGRAETYIERSSTFELSPGMEAIFFINKAGNGFGSSTTWPIADKMLVVNWDSSKMLGEHNIKLTEKDLTGYTIAKLLDTPEEFNTCNLEDFTALIKSLVKQTS
ncbi:MAG: hypothetical protein FWG31_01120 [Oscillospiraceae bacterium]|nr:hypothetical protein [Oscillospiraceae bacterium]